jgi:hypothetical protein
MLRAHGSYDPLHSLLALLNRFENLGLQYVVTGRRTRIAASLAGHGDLDIAVGREDGSRATQTLLDLGLWQRPPHPWFRDQAIADYVGADESTGLPIHVQLHHELRLGRSVTRSFRLPVISYLIATSVPGPPARLPEPAAHLYLHILKSLLGAGARQILGSSREIYDPDEVRALFSLVTREEFVETGRQMLPMFELPIQGDLWEIARVWVAGRTDARSSLRIAALASRLRRKLAPWSDRPRIMTWLLSIRRRVTRRLGDPPGSPARAG